MMIGLLASLFLIVSSYIAWKVKLILDRGKRKNFLAPDVYTLKELPSPSVETGWKVTEICHGVPAWFSKSAVQGSPDGISACQAIIQGSAEKLVTELCKHQVMANLFTDLKHLVFESSKQTLGTSASSHDTLKLQVKANSFCSLEQVVLWWQNEIFLDRFWSADPAAGRSWLYLCPRNDLACSRYGHWVCFLAQDLRPDSGTAANSCVLRVVSSYPAGFHGIEREFISSCTVLCREHMACLNVQKLKSVPSEARLGSDSDADEVARRKLNSRDGSASSGPQSSLPAGRKSSAGPVIASAKRLSGPNNKAEVVGIVETPAAVRRIHSIEDVRTAAVVEKVEPPAQQALSAEVDKLGAVKQGSHDSFPYASEMLDAFKTLVHVYYADESMPSWTNMGCKEGVQVYKMSGDEDCCWDLYKGTVTILAPLPYVLQYITSLEYKKEYDIRFDHGIEIEKFNEVTKVVNLVYQAVWPTSARDFCSLSAVRHLKERLYGVAVRAVVHDKCPPKKSHVRGEVVIGGFVVKDLCTESPSVELTYITRADLKGAIPSRVVNKVASEQPMFAAMIRKYVESRYKSSDPPTSGEQLLAYVHTFPSMLKPVKADTGSGENSEQSLPPVTEEVITVTVDSEVDSAPRTGRTSVVRADKYERIPALRINGEPEDPQDSGFLIKVPASLSGSDEDLAQSLLRSSATNATPYSEEVPPSAIANGAENPLLLREDYYSTVFTSRVSNDESLLDNASVGSISQMTEDLSDVPVTDQELDLPRDAVGNIDFITLGNQAAAALEEEFLLASKVSIALPDTRLPSQCMDEWVYTGTKKNVVIMQKNHSNQKFYSFLGRGTFNVLPLTVWEAIKNPTTRFVYDNMLKRTELVREVTSRHKILHMRHETTACFVKQARDFVVLTVERIEECRYVLAATSVDVAECPPTNDCVRGQVLSSGWIIEPILKNGKPCALVTYISQINFGGRLPIRLINFISKRQPLALAYLREYLENAEL